MEMENETTALKWVFYREVDVPRDIEEMLVTGEVADRAFKTVRDVAVFTNKRLIVKDVQGLTGTKVEMYSLPYSFFSFSTPNWRHTVSSASESSGKAKPCLAAKF